MCGMISSTTCLNSWASTDMSVSGSVSGRVALVWAMVSMSTLRETSNSLRFSWMRAAPAGDAAAARYILRTMARTSPAMSPDMRPTRCAESSCTATIRRRLRHAAPLNETSSCDSNLGRFAKVTSCSVKHSLAHPGDDTTTARRDPRRSENTGPYRSARRDMVACIGFLTRWSYSGAPVLYPGLHRKDRQV
uniref:Uncharacterized protein n=1 Tax=Oryza rufipogon TaxID=4529 RepID=A0A0E0P1L6_ORYRU